MDRWSVAAFYRAFGVWIERATAAEAQQRDLNECEFGEVWEELPTPEKELLLLLSDGWGRAVAWPELRMKLRLGGQPNLTRDFPILTQECVSRKRRVPVRQDGSGDDAVFTLPEHLALAVPRSR